MTDSLASPHARILVADDSRLQREMLASLLGNIGYQIILAEDGLAAIEQFKAHQPDLVLLDIMMPKLDGIQVAREIAALLHNDYVPIVFITSMDSEDLLNKCVAAGGDDFINKPYNIVQLSAKINSLIRVKRLYEELRSQKHELLKYQELYEQEQQVAASLYKNILHADFVETSILRYSLSPMALFNGDILLTSKAPGNRFYVLLGDFTGHGLSASIGAEPTAQIFYGMARKGFAGEEIIKEINRKLHKLLPVNMFLATTLVTLSADSRFMEIITCGLPAHYLLHKPTRKIRSIESKNFPLGIMATYEPKVEYFEIDKHDYLYLFTDGVIEAQNIAGQQFDISGVMACLENELESPYDSILHNLAAHSVGLEQQDDVTFVELHCDVYAAIWQSAGRPLVVQKCPALTWSSHLSFSMETLQKVNPVPVMLNMIMDIQALQSFQEAIFCIVNELFLNSLDYGLLEMDGKLKLTSEGLIKFHAIKEQRIQEVTRGAIAVDFQHQPTEVGGRLHITLKDSGPGFDFASEFKQQRGIYRVNALCSKLEYSHGGREVSAIFDWHYQQ